MTARSPTSIVDKLGAIINEIDRTGHAGLLRLTVLKRWFSHPARPVCLRALGREAGGGAWGGQQGGCG